MPSLAFASDGRPDLYDAQSALQEPFVAQEEPGTTYLQVSTTVPLSVYVEHILEALALPRSMCVLYRTE
jgi:hypothetical protein